MQPIHHGIGPYNLFLQQLKRLQHDPLTPKTPKLNIILEYLPPLTKRILQVDEVVFGEDAEAGEHLSDGVDF